MYSEEIEKLIKDALVDGVVSAKEREILLRKAEEVGIDKDEFEMVLDARIYEAKEQDSNEEEKATVTKKPKSTVKCPNCQANIDSYSTICEYCN